MQSFSDEEREIITQAIQEIRDALNRDVHAVLKAKLGTFAWPGHVLVMQTGMRELEKRSSDSNPLEVRDELVPLVRAVVAASRKVRADKLEALLEIVSDPSVLRIAKAQVAVLDSVMNKPWFAAGPRLRLPRTTDFLTLDAANAMGRNELPARIYDEKFHILQAPTQLRIDLTYFREECGARGRPVTVGYMDVDNFKAFNTAIGEIKVDELILPRLMRLLESFFFGRGFAYRFGGDEYAICLPNVGERLAQSLLDELGAGVRALSFSGFDNSMTMSIGYKVLEADSFVTNMEAVRLAEQAKGEAKTAGKDRVVASQQWGLHEQAVLERMERDPSEIQFEPLEGRFA